jgi:hypothetical protein
MQQNEKRFTLNVTAEELNILFMGLDELPQKYSRKLTDNLMQQVQPQAQPVQGQVNQPPLAGITQKIN